MDQDREDISQSVGNLLPLQWPPASPHGKERHPSCVGTGGEVMQGFEEKLGLSHHE